MTERLLSLLTNRYLELIILPTEKCNFKCVYCYEDFMIGKMTPQIATAIKKFIAKRIVDLDILKLSWFGGEPLIARDIIEDISSYVLALKQKQPELTYIGAMTTNGFLLKLNLFYNLIQLGINNYQISLDGTEQAHDKTRLRLNNGPTFSMIWQNLLAIKQTNYQFSIILRLHLTPDNLNDMALLVEEIRQAFAYDSRFKIFFKAIENLGGPNCNTFQVLHGKAKIDIIKQFYNLLGQELTSVKLTEKLPYICYAASTNSFVIRANGRIAKCTVLLSDSRNDIGTLHEDGSVSIDRDKLTLWTRGIKTNDPRDLHCPATHLPSLPSRLKKYTSESQMKISLIRPQVLSKSNSHDQEILLTNNPLSKYYLCLLFLGLAAVVVVYLAGLYGY